MIVLNSKLRMIRYFWETFLLCARGGIKSNEFWIGFYLTFQIIFQLLNQSNCMFLNGIKFKGILFLTIWLQPVVGVESNELNSNLFSLNFSNIFFFIFESMALQICESNKFWMNSSKDSSGHSWKFEIKPLIGQDKRGLFRIDAL